jgi:hypothetical protein
VAGLILLVSVLVFRRYLPYVGSTLAPEQPPSVVLEMRGAYFVGLDHKGKLWSLKAQKVEIGQSRYVTTLTGITDGRIFDHGKPVLGVEAGKAVYNSIAGDLKMDKGIALTGSDGQKISAAGARWNSATSMLRSNGKVRYEAPWGKASTESVTVDMNTKEMTMTNVVISIQPDKLEGS